MMITPTEMKDHAQDFLMWSFRLILVLMAIALFCFIMNSVASATECQSESDGNGHWSWRYVKPYDHKKCWYRGRSMLPKEQLHWPEKKMIDPIFPKRAEVKTISADEFNELDAQADIDLFFDAKPITLWPPIIFPLMPFLPWQDRIAGALW